MNDIEAGKAKEAEASKQDAGPLQRSAIEEFWKAFERRQCELMQEAGIALSKILSNKH